MPAPERIILIPAAADQAMGQLYISNQADAGNALQVNTFLAAQPRNAELRRPGRRRGQSGALRTAVATASTSTSTRSPEQRRRPPRGQLRAGPQEDLVGRLRLVEHAHHGPVLRLHHEEVASIGRTAGQGHQEVEPRQPEPVAGQAAHAGHGCSKNSSGQWAKNGQALQVPVQADQGFAPLVPIVGQRLKRGLRGRRDDVCGEHPRCRRRRCWATSVAFVGVADGGLFGAKILAAA